MLALLVFIMGGLVHADADPSSLIPNLHLQTTAVTQEHGPFTSPYQGTILLEVQF